MKAAVFHHEFGAQFAAVTVEALKHNILPATSDSRVETSAMLYRDTNCSGTQYAVLPMHIASTLIADAAISKHMRFLLLKDIPTHWQKVEPA